MSDNSSVVKMEEKEATTNSLARSPLTYTSFDPAWLSPYTGFTGQRTATALVYALATDEVPATSGSGGAEDPSLAWEKDGRTYLNGPDQILPSTAIYTWKARGATKINPGGAGVVENLPPISIPSLIRKCAERAGGKIAMRVKRDGLWSQWTYAEYLSSIRIVAKGFIALGLERYHSVCILGFNGPEWFLSNFGAIFAGGFAAGIYTTNAADACAYCAKDSEAQIYVVEDERQLAKVLSTRKQLTQLKVIIQYSGQPTSQGVISWAQLITLGRAQSDTALDARLSSLAINQCCTLIYTSGTTGNPKGVMLSHDNLTWNAAVNKSWAGFPDATETTQEQFISFLPLSHVAAQMIEMYCPLAVCGAVTFADKNALRGTLGETLKEAQPTVFMAVPRVWEKMYERLSEVGRSTKGMKKLVGGWARRKGLECNVKRMNGHPSAENLWFLLADKLVLSKTKAALGFSRCKLILSGAAPIAPDVLNFFMSVNIVVTEGFGMSESTGPHSMGINSAYRIGSVGKTMSGCKSVISSPDKDGNGEILIGGRHVCLGYLGQEVKTKATIDNQGWLHSEDVGRIDEDGYLYITGRLKELIITAGGENVAPIPIENSIKSELPIVSQAVVIGDKLRFLSVILTLKTDLDMNTLEPLDKLTRSCQEWIETKGNCSVSSLTEVLAELYTIKNAQLIQAIQDGIDRVNVQAPSHAQHIQKWTILAKDFSIQGGEFGPTMKLKRNVVCDKYKAVILSMY